MDKINCPIYGGAKKIIPTTVRVNESDSGSASSLYAKINPRTKTRLPIVYQQKQQVNVKKKFKKIIERINFMINPLQKVEMANENGSTGVEPTITTTTAASDAASLSTVAQSRLLTFGIQQQQIPCVLDVNVTSREAHHHHNHVDNSTIASGDSSGHDEALRTIRRRNYPKVLPDLEKRRSLPSNSSSFVLGASFTSMRQQAQGHLIGQHRQMPPPPSPPPRLFGTSRYVHEYH